MRSTIISPCRSHRNARIDAKAAPAPSSLPSQRYSPSKKDKHGGEAAIPPSVPSITLAAVNAANAAAVAAANPWRSIKFPLAPIIDVLELVSSTLPAALPPSQLPTSCLQRCWPQLPNLLSQRHRLLMCPFPLWQHMLGEMHA
jgi:hypothetical protein